MFYVTLNGKTLFKIKPMSDTCIIKSILIVYIRIIFNRRIVLNVNILAFGLFLTKNSSTMGSELSKVIRIPKKLDNRK